MSPAFIKGVKEHLSEQGQETNKVSADNSVEESNTAIYAQSRVDSSTLGLVTAMPKSLHQPQIIFDRYHIVAKANEAVDEVRRSEVKTRPELNPSRYAWLKNESNLTARQRERLTWLARPSMQLKTTRAARWRDDFNGFYEQLTPGDAEPYLRRWFTEQSALAWSQSRTSYDWSKLTGMGDHRLAAKPAQQRVVRGHQLTDPIRQT